MHLVMIGGSDAGISAALRVRELDPRAEVIVPHSAERAATRAGYDGTVPSADRPSGPAQSP